jgi:transcriptional regulator with GAF, ATPase, and Fis domain
VNCAALSPQLVESQLFGHAKGAFTGALSPHEGLFRAADGGTIFLDEIGELPRELQPKLLRVLQEGEVHPVGETRPVKVDVRVVSATLRDLTEMVDEGAFRLDLYARLSPWEIHVPALSERRADILPWLERLHAAWHEEREDSGETVPLRFEANAVERILLHDWRDNLRGLDRLVHRACAEQSGVVDVRPAASAPSTPDRPSSPARKDKPTREELAEVLEAHDGSVRATAKHYDRDRRQIYRWLDQYGLRPKDE